MIHRCSSEVSTLDSSPQSLKRTSNRNNNTKCLTRSPLQTSPMRSNTSSTVITRSPRSKRPKKTVLWRLLKRTTIGKASISETIQFLRNRRAFNLSTWLIYHRETRKKANHSSVSLSKDHKHHFASLISCCSLRVRASQRPRKATTASHHQAHLTATQRSLTASPMRKWRLSSSSKLILKSRCLLECRVTSEDLAVPCSTVEHPQLALELVPGLQVSRNGNGSKQTRSRFQLSRTASTSHRPTCTQ